MLSEDNELTDSLISSLFFYNHFYSEFIYYIKYISHIILYSTFTNTFVLIQFDDVSRRSHVKLVLGSSSRLEVITMPIALK